ncbi:MAG: ligase-associated DNA damage response DEXH box helicase [Gammaproteobacteria bacterium]
MNHPLRSGVDAELGAARAWFAASGRQAFDFQREAWRAYLEGESGLINAPTGTGKTLAAWLGPVIEALHRLVDGARTAGPRVLWITPLRALANDLLLSLREPLAPLGSTWTVEVRTGDTTSSVRKRQRERPPDALIITPESVSVLLSYASSHDQLRNLSCVIVDEWHELLGTKRGVLLELSLSHLRALNPALRVWGLSATLPNLDEALHALMGAPRRGRIIRAPANKVIEVDAVIPRDVSRFPWAGHMGSALVPDVVAAIEKAQTTLLFTNTRAQAEIWYRSLLERRLDWLTTVSLHHGSIDRELRTRIEQGLKRGELRCVVCTSSLDLGVDFPQVDQVIQVGSPKGIGRLMQRAGRSGHRPGAASRILCVPTHAWELIEIAAARAASGERRIEARRPLRLALDVLIQHIVTLAAGPGFDENELLAEVRNTRAYSPLADAEWGWALDFVTRGGTALQGYPQYRRVARAEDGLMRVADTTLARRHRMSIGTISSDTEMTVKWMKGSRLGTVEESFIGRLKPGDDFGFAGRVLKLVLVKDMTAYVRASTARRTQVPRWQGGRLPLSVELADAVLELLGAPEQWSRHPEMLAAAPLLDVQAQWSALPTKDTLLVERVKSREGFHLFMYPFCGRLANEGIATLVAARWARSHPQTFSVNANDYGFELLSPTEIQLDETRLEAALSAEHLADDLLASVNLSEISRRQFRDIARIAGLVFQGFPGSGKTTRQIQASSGLIFDVLERHDPENLLLRQSRIEVLEAQLEFSRISAALKRISGRRLVLKDSRRFTPLGFPLWASRLQTQMLSTESWQTRIERAARELEEYALRAA